MAAKLYSDISGLLLIFILVDRYAGEMPATFFGRKRWAQAKNEMKKHILLDSFPVWLFYPSMINWKINQRDLLDKDNKDYLISTINASLIIEMATFCEGIVSEMQSEIFFDRLGSKGRFLGHINNYFDDKLRVASWTNHIQYFELLLGEKLSTKLENENWKAVSILFSFRNMLVHGKEIEVHYFEEQGKINAESPYGFRKIFEFLKEKKLIDMSFSPNLNSVDMLNSEIIDFLYKNVIEFIHKLFKILPDTEVGDLRKNFGECLTY